MFSASCIQREEETTGVICEDELSVGLCSSCGGGKWPDRSLVVRHMHAQAKRYSHMSYASTSASASLQLPERCYLATVSAGNAIIHVHVETCACGWSVRY